MPSSSIRLFGRVAQGHRVASGLCGDPRFPEGTIAPQLPYFQTAIADFESWLDGPAWPGTINVALTGMTVRPGTPDVVVGPLIWSHHFPPERFLMSRCIVTHDRLPHRAWLYMPDPATKPDHHQLANVLEILTQRLGGLAYRDPVALELPQQCVIVSAADASPTPIDDAPSGQA